jgi:hypothetical protein
MKQLEGQLVAFNQELETYSQGAFTASKIMKGRSEAELIEAFMFY